MYNANAGWPHSVGQLNCANPPNHFVLILPLTYFLLLSPTSQRGPHHYNEGGHTPGGRRWHMTNWLHVLFLKIGLKWMVKSLRDSFHRDLLNLSCFSHLLSAIQASAMLLRSPNSRPVSCMLIRSVRLGSSMRLVWKYLVLGQRRSRWSREGHWCGFAWKYFLAFSMTAYRAKHRRLMRGRSATFMSNSSFWSHSGSEHTATSELVTTLQSSSLPWKRPACTTSWMGKHTDTGVIRWSHVRETFFVEDWQTLLDDSEFPVSLRLWVRGSTHS